MVMGNGRGGICILAPPQDGALFDRHILVLFYFIPKIIIIKNRRYSGSVYLGFLVFVS